MYFYKGQLHPQSTLEISVDHPGLLYGASVFTTLRVYGHLDARLTQWAAHCQRLAHSLATFGWIIPDWAEVRTGALAMLNASASGSLSGYPILRITVFPDGAVLITGRPLPEDLTQRQQQGIKAWVAEPMPTGEVWSRSLPQHKTGNYLAPWLALQQLRSQQTQEALEVILVNSQGDWLETSTGSLWGWYQNQWFTPPLDAGILPGITRAALCLHLRASGQEVIETGWDRHLVEQFQILAYSNAVVEVVPIAEVKITGANTTLQVSQTLRYDPRHPILGDLRHFFLQTDAE